VRDTAAKLCVHVQVQIHKKITADSLGSDARTKQFKYLKELIMERPELAEQSIKADDNQTSLRLLESIRGDYDLAAGAKGVNIKKEAQAIGNCFDFDKTGKSGADISETMDKGANRLSADLQALNKNMPEYNKLLQDLAKKVDSVRSDYYPMSAELKLSDMDSKTGTYKNAFIWLNADSWESHESYRIVQPGNTLSQIAKDSYRALEKEQSDDGGKMSVTYNEFLKGIIDRNKITNPDSLKVGQVLKMSEYL
jgi:hypothetical protein